MRVLIVGGTGYLGSALVDALVRAGHSVTATSRRPRPSGEHQTEATAARSPSHPPAESQQLLRWAVADPSNADSLTPLVEQADAVVNAAVGDESSDAVLARTIRTEEDRDGRSRHLLHLSGCSVYGNHSHSVLDENTDVDPDTPRSRSEAVITADGRARTVFRPGMVFGDDARSSIVGRWFKAAQDGRLDHTGEEGKRWSWVHVDDVGAAAVALLRQSAPVAPQAYLLAAGEPVAPLRVVQAVGRLVNPSLRVGSASIEQEDSLYRVFDRDEVIDARSAQDQLAWTPRNMSVLADLATSYQRWRHR